MLKPTTHRIGLVVPSSNVTMEIEIPSLLKAASTARCSFHSSRMAMRQVSAEELRTMNEQANRCIAELADARVDVFAYACLVAVMVQGRGAHRTVEAKLRAEADKHGTSAPVISSAGALVDTLKRLNAKRVAMVVPYMPALTASVIDYLAAEGIETDQHKSLLVADNFDVGCIANEQVEKALRQFDLAKVDALVLSACVQMPSLDILASVQARSPVPVITAASCTSAAILAALGEDPSRIPGGAGAAWS